MASWLHEKLERGSSIRLDTSSTGSWSSGRTSGICTPKSSTPVPDESFQNHLLEHSLMKIRDNADSAKNDSMAIPEGRKRYFKLIPITAFLLMTLTFQISKVQLQMMRQLKMPLAWHEQFFTTAACIWQVSFAFLSFLLFRHAGLSRWRPRLFLVGDTVPTVDIAICCCNEDIDVISDTIRAALDQDYPRNRYRVIVSDDGHSAELEKHVMSMAADFPNVHYTARPKVGSAGYKAGNLNHVYHHVKSLPHGPAEMMAGLDADLMPERRWLRSMMPHIVQDSRMGCACPPQHFYNQPLNDPLYGTQQNEIRCLERAKDMGDMPWCTGSGWIIRRSALDAIGGFPLGSLTEDILTSMLLLTKGWRVANVPEALQYGLMPETFSAQCKQHVRWCIGGVQVGIVTGFGLSQRKAGAMSLDQRLTLFILTFRCIAPFIFMLGLLGMPILLFTNTRLIYYDNLRQLRYLLRLKCLLLFGSWLNNLVASMFTCYEAVLQQDSNTIWESPYHAWAILRSFILPKWLGGKVTGFVPTGTIPDGLNERHPTRRSPLRLRLKVVLFDCGAIFHVIMAIAIFLGIIYRVHLAHRTSATSREFYIELLTVTLSPPLGWLQQVLAFLTPLQYAIWPPAVPDRENLLDRDPTTGVASPRKECRHGNFRFLGTFGYPQLIHVTLFATIGVYIGTWWL